MGIWDTITDFATDNKDWLRPTLSTAGNLYSQYQTSGNNSNMIDYLKQREQANYDTQKANYDSYAQWAVENQAAQNAASAAANAAKQATEAARQEALQKAMKSDKKSYKRQMGYINPYVQAGKSVLGGRTESANQASGLANMLNAYLSSPQAQQQMSMPVQNPMNINIPLPEFMTKGA